MAIAPTTGAAASLSSAATTLSFAANTLTNSRIVIVVVSILDTTKSVSGVSDGANTYTLIGGGNNASNVRVEMWAATVSAATASRTITITFSGATLASAAYEEYSGSTGTGRIGSLATGNLNVIPAGGATTQDNGSWLIAAMAVATLSSDGFLASNGTIRQSVIPALTSGSIALVDLGPLAYAAATTPQIQMAGGPGVQRQYATFELELRTGTGPGTALSVVASKFVGPCVRSAQNYQVVKPPPQTVGTLPRAVAEVLQGGILGTAYSETISVQGGVSPYAFSLLTGSLPAGTSLNTSTGVISGVPTAAATYNFTIQVVDANGIISSQAFEITTVVASSGGGNFAWAY
jgi:large repetitive protein